MKNRLYHQHVLKRIAKRIYDIKGKLEVSSALTGEPVSWEEHKKLSYQSLEVGKLWGKKLFDCGWMIVKGKRVGHLDEVAIVDIGGEGLVYDQNGHMITAITTTSNQINHFQVFKGKTIIPLGNLSDYYELHIDASYNGSWQAGSYSPRLRRCDIAIKNRDYHEFYYQYRTIYTAMISLSDSKLIKDYHDILIASAKLIEKPKEAMAMLKKAFEKHSTDPLQLYAIGHGHLDLAWLWPLRESHRKAARTLLAQLNNVKDYPGYIYGVSQPQMLLWVKDEYPDLFNQIKEAFKNGSFEAQGGMWNECDCNLTGGESFIRQFHYGTKFWETELGINVRTCWLPDVFGFSGALPQIIKGCGMDSFMTIKLSWNRMNKFPHHSFRWIGIDGTGMLSHMGPEGDYTSAGSPLSLMRIKKSYKEQEIAPEALLIYGVGDGGCGPSEGHIEMVRYEHNLEGLPKTTPSSAQKFFDLLRKDEDQLKDYSGELYLERHQGTFTTQAVNKKYNRKLEIKLHLVEFLLAKLWIKKGDIEKFPLDDIWKEILLYQFHDILPGSSIHRVYQETKERYQIIDKNLDEYIHKITNLLSASSGLFNPAPVSIHTVGSENGKVYAFDAPAYGNVTKKEIENPQLNLLKDGFENSRLIVKFNKKGEIISCYDKLLKIESVKRPLNQLVVYSDPRILFNAWDIYPKYEWLPKRKFHLINSSKRIENEAVIVSNHYRYHHSELWQDVILRCDSPIIEFNTKVDWHEKHKMLRTNFYPVNYGETTTCDIQFGTKEYRTLEDNTFDKAKYEISAHKFVDITKDDYGFALINDSKYGHRIKNGKISMALLRSPVYPDPKADRGHHEFKYAIYPHSGNYLEANVQEYAYAFNHELLPYQLDDESILTSSNPQVLVETIKPSFDGLGIAVRLYEKSGNQQSTKLIFDAKFELYETTMLEKTPVLATSDVDFHPFEIKTFILRSANHA